MTDRAVQPDMIEAESATPRDANRQIVAAFHDKAKRGKPSGQLVATHRWKRFEHPVGREDAADGTQEMLARFAANGSVLEVIGHRGKGERPIAADHEQRPDCRDGRRREDGLCRPPEHETRRFAHTNADGWKTDMTCASISSRLANRLCS